MNFVKNNKGAVVELVLLLVVGLLILGGLYVYSTQSPENGKETAKVTQTPAAGQTDLGSVVNPTITPTPLPEVSSIPTDSGDTDIDSAAQEVNTLMDGVDKLDDTSKDLDGLNADFSVSF